MRAEEVRNRVRGEIERLDRSGLVQLHKERKAALEAIRQERERLAAEEREVRLRLQALVAHNTSSGLQRGDILTQHAPTTTTGTSTTTSNVAAAAAAATALYRAALWEQDMQRAAYDESSSRASSAAVANNSNDFSPFSLPQSPSRRHGDDTMAAAASIAGARASKNIFLDARADGRRVRHNPAGTAAAAKGFGSASDRALTAADMYGTAGFVVTQAARRAARSARRRAQEEALATRARRNIQLGARREDIAKRLDVLRAKQVEKNMSTGNARGGGIGIASPQQSSAMSGEEGGGRHEAASQKLPARRARATSGTASKLASRVDLIPSRASSSSASSSSRALSDYFSADSTSGVSSVSLVSKIDDTPAFNTTTTAPTAAAATTTTTITTIAAEATNKDKDTLAPPLASASAAAAAASVQALSLSPSSSLSPFRTAEHGGSNSVRKNSLGASSTAAVVAAAAALARGEQTGPDRNRSTSPTAGGNATTAVNGALLQLLQALVLQNASTADGGYGDGGVIGNIAAGLPPSTADRREMQAEAARQKELRRLEQEIALLKQRAELAALRKTVGASGVALGTNRAHGNNASDEKTDPLKSLPRWPAAAAAVTAVPPTTTLALDYTKQPYDEDSGVLVRFDFAADLPPIHRASTWRLEYSLMQGDRILTRPTVLLPRRLVPSAGRSTVASRVSSPSGEHSCSNDGGSVASDGDERSPVIACFPPAASFCITDCPARVTLSLLIKLCKTSADGSGKNDDGSGVSGHQNDDAKDDAVPVEYGWTKLRLFDDNLDLRAGPQRIPLRQLPVILGASSSTLRSLPVTGGNASIYVRIEHARLHTDPDAGLPNGLNVRYPYVEDRPGECTTLPLADTEHSRRGNSATTLASQKRKLLQPATNAALGLGARSRMSHVTFATGKNDEGIEEVKTKSSSSTTTTTGVGANNNNTPSVRLEFGDLRLSGHKFHGACAVRVTLVYDSVGETDQDPQHNNRNRQQWRSNCQPIGSSNSKRYAVDEPCVFSAPDINETARLHLEILSMPTQSGPVSNHDSRKTKHSVSRRNRQHKQRRRQSQQSLQRRRRHHQRLANDSDGSSIGSEDDSFMSYDESDASSVLSSDDEYAYDQVERSTAINSGDISNSSNNVVVGGGGGETVAWTTVTVSASEQSHMPRLFEPPCDWNSPERTRSALRGCVLKLTVTGNNLQSAPDMARYWSQMAKARRDIIAPIADIPPGSWESCIQPPLGDLTPYVPGRGEGIDLYIDSARFLPYNVTISKVVGRIFSSSYEKQGADISTSLELDSDPQCPEYGLRTELRRGTMASTSTLLVKVYTIDAFSKELVVVGYAALPIFLDAGTGKQPLPGTKGGSARSGGGGGASSSPVALVLNEGAHQIRLYHGGPDPALPLTGDCLRAAGRRPIPCASLLVRLRAAARDGRGEPLVTSNIPRERWEKLGIVVPPQPYATGVYQGDHCRPTVEEAALYRERIAARGQHTVRSIISLVGDGREQRLKTDKSLQHWVRSRLTRAAGAKPADASLDFLCRYCPSEGFCIQVVSAHMLARARPSHCLVTLCPPGVLYGKRADSSRPRRASVGGGIRDSLAPLSDHTQTQRTTIWDSRTATLRSPQWGEEVFTFTGAPIEERRAFIVLDVRTFDPKARAFHGLAPQGFAILPINHADDSRYVRTGEFTLPLFAGFPSASTLKQLLEKGVSPALWCDDTSKGQRGLKRAGDTATIVVRICDKRRGPSVLGMEGTAAKNAAAKSAAEGGKDRRRVDKSKLLLSSVPRTSTWYEYTRSLDADFSHGLAQAQKESNALASVSSSNF
eukprot:UC1_evm3s445